MKKLNKGFTVIELLIVIAIIGILATTLAPKLLKEIRKATVAEVQHNLGVIRSRLSLDETLSEEFPDFFLDENIDKTNLLKSYSIEPTPAFTSADGVSHKETSQVVTPRDNTGGWFYIRETGEIYANLPNGAYTKDKEYEIWNGEDIGGNTDGGGGGGDSGDKSDWDNINSDKFYSTNVQLGTGGYVDPNGNINLLLAVNNLSGIISNGALTGNYSIYVDNKLVNELSGNTTQNGNALIIPQYNQNVGSDNAQALKVAFEYIDQDGNIKFVYNEVKLQ